MRRTGIKHGTKRLERRTGLSRGDAQLKRTPLNEVSKKRARENRERTAMVNKLWPDRTPRCAKPDCGRLADDLHEPLTRARQGSITDPNNGTPVCRAHNSELTREPAWGYELALLIHSWEKTPLPVLASVRRQLLAGEVPVEDIAYCGWCRLWLPTDHDCAADSTTEDEDYYGSPSDLEHPA
jgi:hypothetical protein